MNRHQRSIVLDAQQQSATLTRIPVPLTARISRDQFTDAIVVLLLIGEVQARLVKPEGHPRNRKEAEQLVRDFLAGLGVQGAITWDVTISGET